MLGAVRPQYLSPPPVPVWRNPLSWLQALGDGIAFVTDNRAEMRQIMLAFRGGVVAEDPDHGAELRALLERPWPAPPVYVRDAQRGVT